MTVVSRLRVAIAVLGMTTLISWTLVRGDSSNRTTKPIGSLGTLPTRLTSGEFSSGKFSRLPLITSDTQDGEAIFALQIQPKLDPVADRPRDLVILVDTSASQAGKALNQARELTDAFVRDAGKRDRASIWTVNIPREKSTRSLTGGLVQIKPDNGAGLEPRLAVCLKDLGQEYASGAVDLPGAIRRAVKNFEGKSARKQMMVYLGDGESAFAPMTEKIRHELAQELKGANVSFFAVPLGGTLNSQNMHSLAIATGGSVVRIQKEDEDPKAPLASIVSRLNKSMQVPVLMPSALKFSAEVAEVFPSKLPPLRADAPTLVVGRLKKRPADKLTVNIEGKVVGKEISLPLSFDVPESSPDHFFLNTIFKQWKSSPISDAPALLRADRTLALAFEQSRLAVEECLTQANWAINANQFEAAKDLFLAAKVIDPADQEAAAGLGIVEKLKSGVVTKDQLVKAANAKQSGVKIEAGEDGTIRTVAVQIQPVPEVPAQEKASVDDLLKAEQARQAVVEKQVTVGTEQALRDARKLLQAGDPDSAKELLLRQRETLLNNSDLSEATRQKLLVQVSAISRDVTERGGRIREQIEKEREMVARAQQRLFAANAKQDSEEQIRARVDSFRQLMQQARYEDAYREALIQQQERTNAGLPVSVETTAVYQMGQVGANLREARELVRLREDRFLLTMMSVEKSHVPYPDEPPVHFPPAKVWKDLTSLRKKYASSDFEGDVPRSARQTSRYIGEIMVQPVTFAFPNDELALPLDDAFKAVVDFANPTREGDKDTRRVPIIINKAAIAAAQMMEAFDTSTIRITIRKDWSGLSLQTILRLMSDQIPKGATYVIRPDHIEITSADSALRDKVIRTFPVDDLVIPIPNGISQQSLNQSLNVLGQTFSLNGGGTAFGFTGAFGNNGNNQNINQNNAGGGNGAAGNLFNGQGNGQGNNQGAGGGLQGFSGGALGQFGNLGGQFGFQGGNQSSLLVQLITDVVARGEWATASSVLGGNGGGGNGTDPMDPSQVATPAEFLNSLGYYQPSRALVIRGTSRFHKSYSSKLNIRPGGGLAPAAFAPNVGDKKVAANTPKLPEKDLNPKKIWQDAVAKGVPNGQGEIIACADFLAQTREFKHAAELLKAGMRQGLTPDSWAHEALAIALEATQGDAEELERARMSAIDLEPKNAQGYLKASKTMSEAGHKEAALMFCRQAAKLEPNLPDPYINAMVYAGDMKKVDSDASVWAASNLLRRDWPIDTKEYHVQAQKHLESLIVKLRAENRPQDIGKVEAVTETEKVRDLTIQLLYSGSADLDLKVREPIGTVCSILQKQTTGGGTLQPDQHSVKDDSWSETYSAAEAFSGSYQITIDKIWGRPLGNKATIRVIRHQGTPDQKIELHTLDLTKENTLNIQMDTGRRSELASLVNPTMAQDGLRKADRNTDAMTKLTTMINPTSTGVNASIGGGTAASTSSVTKDAFSSDNLPASVTTSYSGRVGAVGGSLEMQGTLTFSSKSNLTEMRVAPVFQTSGRTKSASLKLEMIPGSEV